MRSLELFENPQVLKQLAKTWHAFSDFRLACARIPESEALLNVLSVLSAPDYTDLMKGLRPDALVFSEIELFRLHWGKPFGGELLAVLLSRIEGEQVPVYGPTEALLAELDVLDLDPFFKGILFQQGMAPYLQDRKYPLRCFRILTIFGAKHFGLLQEPVLFPDEYFSLSINGTLSPEFISSRLNFFVGICLLGKDIILQVAREISVLRRQIEEAEIFPPLNGACSMEVILSQLVLSIPKLMDLTLWKRDKAARALSRLCRGGYYQEIKQGKEKLFINQGLLSIFLRVEDRRQEIFGH